eukprot:1449402-Rhodomonas_salina.2
MLSTERLPSLRALRPRRTKMLRPGGATGQKYVAVSAKLLRCFGLTIENSLENCGEWQDGKCRERGVV